MDVAFTKKYFSHVSALSLYENCRAYPTAMTTISRHMNCLVVRVRGGQGIRWGRGGCGMPGRTYPQSHHTAAELKPCPRDCRPQAHEESALAAVVLIKVSRQLTVGLWRPSSSPTSDLWDCVKVSPAEGANICSSHVHGACMTSVCFFPFTFCSLRWLRFRHWILMSTKCWPARCQSKASEGRVRVWLQTAGL